MSKYTTQVRFICENYANLDESAGYDDINNVLNLAAPHVFSFSFPIYDEAHRLPLEMKILKHYYTREICAETVGRWKLFLEDRLNEIMPYYNQLYESAAMEFDPFLDTDYTVDHAGDSSSEGSTHSEDSRTTNESGEEGREWSQHDKSSHWNLYSDTPQGGIVGIENASTSLSSNAYLTNATHEIHDGTGTGGQDDQDYSREGAQEGSSDTTSASSSEDSYLDKIKGKRGGQSYSKMLEEYRSTIINIDKMIIDDLADLFFTLWE